MGLNLFSIQWRAEQTREMLAVRNSANTFGYETTICKEPIPGSIPIGSVEYCEQALPDEMRHIMPKPMYPEWTKSHLKRWIKHVVDQPQVYWRPTFVKRADVWKADPPCEPRVRPPGEALEPGHWWLSEVIDIVEEWRYYVVDGVVLSSGWYDGESQDKTDPPAAPTLPFAIPSDYAGALDCGILRDGKIAVIESHWPFACGWYGEDPEEYTYWQIEAWRRFMA